MFRTLRQHKTWLWGILIIVVIISFVIFFSPDVNRNPEARPATVGRMDGKPVDSDTFRAAYFEADLLYFLNNGQRPQEGRGGWDGENEAKQRLILKDRAAKAGIKVSSEAATIWLQSLPIFKDKQGNYSPAFYERFITNVLNPSGYSRYMLEELAKSEMGIKQLITTVGLPGAMVSPRYATTSLQAQKEIYVAELATFPLSNFLASVENIAEADLQQYYTNRMASYRIPEKMQVHYVEFPATNYFDAGMALFTQKEKVSAAEFADKIYKENDPELYVDEEGNTLSEAAAKEKIITEIHKAYSLRAARSAAAEFVNTYFAAEKFSEQDYLEAAKAKGFTAKLSEPFSRTDGKPEALDFPASFAQAAWNLSPTNAVIPPVVGQTNVYAICFAGKIESKTPEYSEVAEKVLEDYKKAEAVKACNAAARAFATSVTNQLASGKSFQEAATESKAQFMAIPEFTADAESVDIELPAQWWQIKNAVSFKTAPSVCSPIIPASPLSTNAVAAVVYLKERKPADPAVVEAELTNYTKGLLADNLQSVFTDWFMAEYDKANFETARDIEKKKQEAMEQAAREAEAQATASTNQWSPTPGITNAPAKPITTPPAAPSTN